MTKTLYALYGSKPFLHFYTITLLNEFDVKNTALRTLNKRTNNHLNELEEKWEQIKQKGETLSNRSVVEELRDWQQAIDRFNKSRKE